MWRQIVWAFRGHSTSTWTEFFFAIFLPHPPPLFHVVIECPLTAIVQVEFLFLLTLFLPACVNRVKYPGFKSLPEKVFFLPFFFSQSYKFDSKKKFHMPILLILSVFVMVQYPGFKSLPEKVFLFALFLFTILQIRFQNMFWTCLFYLFYQYI